MKELRDILSIISFEWVFSVEILNCRVIFLSLTKTAVVDIFCRSFFMFKVNCWRPKIEEEFAKTMDFAIFVIFGYN